MMLGVVAYRADSAVDYAPAKGKITNDTLFGTYT